MTVVLSLNFRAGHGWSFYHQGSFKRSQSSSTSCDSRSTDHKPAERTFFSPLLADSKKNDTTCTVLLDAQDPESALASLRSVSLIAALCLDPSVLGRESFPVVEQLRNQHLLETR